MARSKGAHRVRSFYAHDEKRLARLKSGGSGDTLLYDAYDASKPSLKRDVVCLREGGIPEVTLCQYFKTGIEMAGQLYRSGGRREGICTGECAWRIYDGGQLTEGSL